MVACEACSTGRGRHDEDCPRYDIETCVCVGTGFLRFVDGQLHVGGKQFGVAKPIQEAIKVRKPGRSR